MGTNLSIGLNGEIELVKGGPGSGPRPGVGTRPGNGKVQAGQAVSLTPNGPNTHVIERPASGKSGHFDLRDIASNSISHMDVSAKDLQSKTRSPYFEDANRGTTVGGKEPYQGSPQQHEDSRRSENENAATLAFRNLRKFLMLG